MIVSAPIFSVCFPSSRVACPAICVCNWFVLRGKISDRPKPLITFSIFVSGAVLFGWLACRSRENCTLIWLDHFGVHALVSVAFALSVATLSSPLFDVEKFVIGLPGSKNTLFDPQNRETFTRVASCCSLLSV